MSTKTVTTTIAQLPMYVDVNLLTDEREIDCLDIILHVMHEVNIHPFAAGGNADFHELYFCFWTSMEAERANEMTVKFLEAWGKTAVEAYNLATSLDEIRKDNAANKDIPF